MFMFGLGITLREKSSMTAKGSMEHANEPQRDRPWLFRTYAGQSTAAASNELFRNNLARGQTGLSVAFDLPTQMGYDSDHPLATGEVGKVGVPVCHLGDLGHVPTSEQVEELSGVDVLLAPVGGNTTIGATAAAETVSLLGPKLVLPMHYQTPAEKQKDLEPLDRFLREMGATSALEERQSKLSVTKSTLPQETKVQVLDYRTK